MIEGEIYRPLLLGVASSLLVMGLGLGALSVRPDPVEYLDQQGKTVVGVVLGCAKVDRWIDARREDPALVIVAYNPTEHGGDELCKQAVAELPSSWRLTPQEACSRLIEGATQELD